MKSLDRLITQEEFEKIKKLDKIGEGKCANLYRNDNDVYKIIKQDAKKIYGKGIEALVGLKSEICVFPKELLRDNENGFVGYVMDYVPGTKLKNVFSKIPFKQLQQIIDKAQTGIEDLSEQKIIFEDMHYDNMMWDDEDKSIKIIDTDFFKLSDDILIEELKKSNLSKFNRQMETIIGLEDYTLKKYLSRNKEYKEFYKESNNNRGKLNVCELIEKIKKIAERDFGTEFNSISEIVERAKSKVKEYEYEDLDIESWSEGNEHLKNLLTSCRDNEVPFIYSCIGHGKGKPSYITVEMNEQTIGKIYNIIVQMSDIKDISFRFAQKEFGKDPNFTIYINKEKNKDEIMDIISQAMTQEKSRSELPENLQMITQIVDIFQNEDIGFDLVYGIEKNSNSLLLENLKFANSKHMDNSDFKKMGLKLRKDKYIRKGIKDGPKEQQMLGNMLRDLSKIYDIEQEISSNDTFEQKVEKKKGFNNILSRLPFVNRFISSKSKMLPESVNKHSHSFKEQKDEFSRSLSNNGEYRKLSNKGINIQNQTTSETEKTNDSGIEQDDDNLEY